MTPIIPHFANECLEQLDANDKNIWPDVEKNLLEKIEYNIVIQINGKKRDLLKLNKEHNEKEILEKVMKSEKCFKYMESRKIKKTIYVKNKLLNVII